MSTNFHFTRASRGGDGDGLGVAMNGFEDEYFQLSAELRQSAAPPQACRPDRC